MFNDEKINDLRNEIEKITIKIIKLCMERLMLVKEIGKIKTQKSLPIENLQIEMKLKKKVDLLCKKYAVDSISYLKILEILLIESKKIQKEIM